MTTPPPPQPPYGQDPYQPPPTGSPQDPYQQQPPPSYPVSGGPQPPYSPYPPAYPPGPAGYAYDPMTGQPYSDKSKMAAGLLQLLIGFVAIGGIGRLYAGHVTIGVIQLLLGVVGWISLCCGFATLGLAWIIAFPLLAANWLWSIIDGILILAGQPTDGQGRPLRP